MTHSRTKTFFILTVTCPLLKWFVFRFFHFSGGAKAAETPASGGGAVAKKQEKKKKKRKIRLPKNYEPGVPPDPERWLPRRERAGYRGRRRDKRQANLLRGPQGATSNAAPELWVLNDYSSVI